MTTLHSLGALVSGRKLLRQHIAFMLLLLPALVCVKGCSPETTSEVGGLTDEDRAAIEKMRVKFENAFRKGNWDALTKFFHPETELIRPDAPPERTAEEIRKGLKLEEGWSYSDLSLTRRELKSFGNMAYGRGTVEVVIEKQAAEQASKQKLHGHYLVILRRNQEGNWRIYRAMWSRDHPALGSGK